MKALSLLQPWAQLVVLGAKKFETRSWPTEYRGRILIHASLGKDSRDLSFREPFDRYIGGLIGFYRLPFGAIIGEATIEEMIPTLDIGGTIEGMDEWHFGDYTPGRWAWRLSDPLIYDKPIPCKGQLGLWEYKMAA